jgi:hypothetical protein
MKDSGKEDSETDGESKSGLMALSMWETGEKIRLRVKADLYMSMVISMMASG